MDGRLFGLHSGLDDGSNRGHRFFLFFVQLASSFPRRKRMNSPPWNDAVSLAEMGIFILPPEVLMFCN